MVVLLGVLAGLFMEEEDFKKWEAEARERERQRQEALHPSPPPPPMTAGQLCLITLVLTSPVIVLLFALRML